MPRTGDFTLADFWGIGKAAPFHHDTSQGVSLLLVNSKHATEVFRYCCSNIFFEKRELLEAQKYNAQLYRASEYPPGRKVILSDIENMSIEAFFVKYHLKKKLSIKEVVREGIRFAIGSRGVALLKKCIRGK